MKLSQTRLRRRAHSQAGFTLVEVMVAVAIVTLLAVLAARDLRRQGDESAAEATGRYLMQIRGAVVDLQLKHEAWLRGEDLAGLPAGSYPPPPALTWASVAGAQVARGGMADLTALGLLPATIPRYPALGDVARFILVRQGACPGDECRTSAFVYACHPISAVRSLRQNAECTPPTVNRSVYDQTLLSKVVVAAEGYGGHDARGSANVRGPLMDIPRAWFDFGTQPGHAVIAASLDSTPFGQFVRHGETRPVTFNNTLTVAGAIQTNTGLLLNTAVAPGAACTPEGLYASTANKLLAVCTGGVWFAQTGHVITGTYGDLPNDAAIPAVTCPAGLSPWRQVALQATDATARGSDINIGGAIGGSIQGSGYVNAAGAVSVGGSFSGTFQNSGNSYVRMAQRASIAGDRVVISPPDMGARASVIQGCKN
ncbi:prepilin-type N-terminal cleavage/methylation domain-containing protein [Achromobacter sp. MY14]|uniref:Prepilin-type N-terminal cleavage/methylation domain-containing protein n=1 Tax=Achromobacter spanius TaxID=217203 RepID=A0AA42LVR3_9BURK|nr:MULTISPECIES: prepilin-type N-terminal cleavage/methylation domain-containing protein [Achromobacter]MCD0495222.1 prepilin-type N-terminal cleavage/methylation domain-containing protein [Achromobacter sp. MY14]MDH0740356.1 prepilin-type N-terminal cleavage/methylation domain-containing protein [Achromobacter spanius]